MGYTDSLHLRTFSTKVFSLQRQIYSIIHSHTPRVTCSVSLFLKKRLNSHTIFSNNQNEDSFVKLIKHRQRRSF